MFNNDQISSAAWFFIGLLILIFSIPYGLGEVHSPGTGFMPFYTGLAMCALSALIFMEATRAKKSGAKWENPLKGTLWVKPLIALVALIVYALLMDKLGFILATALLVGFLLRGIHPQKWSVVIGGAILTSLVTYLVFQVWLKTQLPAGILSF
jgi:putative tricarboxylic transport membrane protein